MYPSSILYMYLGSMSQESKSVCITWCLLAEGLEISPGNRKHGKVFFLRYLLNQISSQGEKVH